MMTAHAKECIQAETSESGGHLRKREALKCARRGGGGGGEREGGREGGREGEREGTAVYSCRIA
eukprot:COSAG03_NODE_13901_length_484_cov_1.192208_1_plen_64_part_00